jgi:hypothetical protein
MTKEMHKANIFTLPFQLSEGTVTELHHAGDELGVRLGLVLALCHAASPSHRRVYMSKGFARGQVTERAHDVLLAVSIPSDSNDATR